jgi:hypothetical protein
MDCMEPGSKYPVAEKIVDMIQASETMTDAELERIVSEADPAIIERLERITAAMARRNRPRA